MTEEELDLLPAPPKAPEVEPTRPTTSKHITYNPAAVAPHSPPNDNPLYDPAIPLMPAIKLIGREKEIAQIKKQLLSGGNVALTALNGLPGVGKTALSITLAHDAEVRRHFKDGVLWAGLGPRPNIAGLLSRWGTLLGISATQMEKLTTNEAWAKELRRVIGMRAMLLVIDDAWQLDEAQVFRVGGPHCVHLVTTRFPNIAAYITIDGATMIKELNAEDSLKLLNALAPQVVSHEEQKAHDLVHAVGGLPLALTLMGNYLRKQAYSGPARRITAAIERLTNIETRLTIHEPHVPAESHPSLPVETSLSLQSVIAVTDQLLTPKTRATLYALAVFPPKPNTFSEEAALAVAACGYEELDTLCDTGLLEVNGGDRYQLHQIIADYARLHLKGDEAAAADERLIAFVVAYVEERRKDYEQLELESGLIVNGIERALNRGKQQEFVRAVCAFAPFLILRGFYGQAETYLKQAHEIATTHQDTAGITKTLLYLGQIAQKGGNFTLAEDYFSKGLSLARTLGEQEQICALLNDLGAVSWRKGDLAQAEAYLQEGLTIARHTNDLARICGILKILGSVVGSKGDYTLSETYLNEGLKLARQIGDREQTCVLLMNLGATAGGQGKFKQAEDFFKEGLVIARQIGHREWMSAILGNLGAAAVERGEFKQAEIFLQEGLELARQIGHREWISVLLNNLGLATQRQEKYTEAELYLQEGLSLARQIGRVQLIANALYECGNLYLKEHKIEQAESTFEEIYRTTPKDDQVYHALAHYGMARAALSKGDANKALDLGNASATTLEKIGHHTVTEVKQWLASAR